MSVPHVHMNKHCACSEKKKKDQIKFLHIVVGITVFDLFMRPEFSEWGHHATVCAPVSHLFILNISETTAVQTPQAPFKNLLLQAAIFIFVYSI